MKYVRRYVQAEYLAVVNPDERAFADMRLSRFFVAEEEDVLQAARSSVSV